MDSISSLSYQVGVYTKLAVASCFGKGTSFPEKPIFNRKETDDSSSDGKGKGFTDAEKFMHYMYAHNEAKKSLKGNNGDSN